jgi:hypothetical protein
VHDVKLNSVTSVIGQPRAVEEEEIEAYTTLHRSRRIWMVVDRIVSARSFAGPGPGVWNIEPGYEQIREVSSCEQTSRGRVADDVLILAWGLRAGAVRVPSASRRFKMEITIDY